MSKSGKRKHPVNVKCKKENMLYVKKRERKCLWHAGKEKGANVNVSHSMWSISEQFQSNPKSTLKLLLGYSKPIVYIARMIKWEVLEPG